MRMISRYQNPLKKGMIFNFPFLLDICKIMDKYIGVGDGDGPPHSNVMPTSGAKSLNQGLKSFQVGNGINEIEVFFSVIILQFHLDNKI